MLVDPGGPLLGLTSIATSLSWWMLLLCSPYSMGGSFCV